VTFGGTLATGIQVQDAVHVRATTPPGPAGAVEVLVRHNGSQASRSFLYDAPVPVILSVQPLEGPSSGGVEITVGFENFEGTGNLELFFGDEPATNVVVNGTELTATLPPQASGEVPVRLKRGGLEATYGEAFTYRSPRIVSVDPASGLSAGGLAVTIQVEDFGEFTTSPQVRFGGNTAQVVSWAANSIGVLSPSADGPGTVALSVEHGPYSALRADAFTYSDAGFGLTSIDPASGSNCGGETVTLHGFGFSSAPSTPVVLFGGQPAGSVTVLSDQALEVVTPPAQGEEVLVAVGVSLDGTDFVEKPDGFAYDVDRRFRRGDTDGNGVYLLNDVQIIGDLISGARSEIYNLDAADVNDDGLINASDMILLAEAIFNASGTIPPPFPDPGCDPTPDLLGRQ